jgi:dephospho-CoA kinase
MPFVVGLTGGIACGKSTVSSRLRDRVPIIDLDELARRVLLSGRPAYRKVVARFGSDVLLPDETIDREKLGAIVFADRQARRALNGATHWSILWELLSDLARHAAAGAPLVVLDAPLLFESKLDLLCGTTVVVHTSRETQLARLQRRDGHAPDEAERRIAAQMPLHLKMARAEHLVDNDGDLSATNARIETLATALEHRQAAWTWADSCRAALLRGVLALVWALGG